MPASATQKGVDRRSEALADIVKNRNTALAAEMQEGGSSAEDIAAVTAGTAAVVSDDDPKRPKDIAPEDWAKMSDEEKGSEIASAAAAIAGETDEQKAERERLAAEAKAEEERKAAAGAPKKIKIKVDGQEQEVDESAVLEAGMRTLQKESAADKRLEEATKARDEAERLRKTVEDTIARAGAPAAKAKTDQEMIVAKEGLRDIVKQIQYGTPDEAAGALVEYGNKMASLGQAGRLTETELHNILDLREAQRYVKAEYADVMGDANLKDLFVIQVNKKLAAGDGRPYQEICKETGDALRAWKAPAKADPTAAAAAAAAAGGSRAAAQQRKVSTVSIPAAAARQQAASSEPKAPPSNAELVEQARKSRGQA